MILQCTKGRLQALTCVLVFVLLTTEAQRAREIDGRNERRFGASGIRCQDLREIVFVAFFPGPCLSNNTESHTLDGGVDGASGVGECDFLVEAAARLAVDRVNQDPTVLPNITLRLHPVYTAPREVSTSLPV